MIRLDDSYSYEEWMNRMATDVPTDLSLDDLSDGDEVMLHPLPCNPIHKKPVRAIFSGGYFYCDGTSPMDGPDYYFGDVLTYCRITEPPK